jgi:hypothetical protein
MSEPHKVIEPRNLEEVWAKAELTAQDVVDILGETALSSRFAFKPYQLAALFYAQEALQILIDDSQKEE